MPATDPRIDAYIDQAATFAQPILRHLRMLVHRHCPQVEESIKWGMPYFLDHGLLCHMAAFKQHCAFGFWHPTLRAGIDEGARAGAAMGQFGRIASLADLPDDATLGALLEQAVQLNRDGAKVPRGARAAKPALPVPPDMAAALDTLPLAQAAFDALPPSHRREYIEWVCEAKAEATRQRRLAQALEQLAQGRRHGRHSK